MILNQNNHQKNGNEVIHYHQPKKLTGKVLCSFSWDHKGIILKESTPMGITITKTYYADILVNKLHSEIKKQWQGLISVDVILHGDTYILSTIDDLKYELLRHPSYSPDLALSDSIFCFLF